MSVIFQDLALVQDWDYTEAIDFLCDFKVPTVMPNFHSHPQIEINVLFNGQVSYAFNQQSLSLHAGEIIVFWATTPHRVTSFSSDAKMGLAHIPVSLLLSSSLNQSIIANLMNGGIARIANQQLITAGEMQRWQHSFNEQNSAKMQLVQEEIKLMVRRFALNQAVEFEHSIKRAKSHRGFSDNSKKNIEMVLAFIAENYTQDIRIEDIATHVKLHPKYLMNLFQQNLNVSIKKYINLLRLNHVKQLLLNTDLPVQQISLAAGFNHTSSFFATFKSYHGLSPQQYRQYHIEQNDSVTELRQPMTYNPERIKKAE